MRWVAIEKRPGRKKAASSGKEALGFREAILASGEDIASFILLSEGSLVADSSRSTIGVRTGSKAGELWKS